MTHMTPPPDAPPSETNPAALVATMPFAVASGVEIERDRRLALVTQTQAVITL